MARRNDHSRKDIKQMAISAGLAIIEEKGFSALSTRNVANRIGYSVGTIYNVFENFYDLVFNINYEILKDLYFFVKEGIDGKQGVEAIKNMASSYLDYAIKFPNKWNALFEYDRPSEQQIPVWYLEKVNKLLILLEHQLIPIFGGDELTAKKASRIIWGGTHGLCTLGLTHRLGGDDTEALKSMSNSLIENYIKGITIIS